MMMVAYASPKSEKLSYEGYWLRWHLLHQRSEIKRASTARVTWVSPMPRDALFLCSVLRFHDRNMDNSTFEGIIFELKIKRPPQIFYMTS